MQLPDNALTRRTAARKSRPLTSSRWWRWTRYELRDGWVRPAPGARLCTYDPFELWRKTRPTGRRSDQGTPYRELLEMLQRLEYRSDSEAASEFTPAEVDMLAGPLTEDSEKAILSWCSRYGLLGILPHRAVQVTLSPKDGDQVQYIRIGIGWAEVKREMRGRIVLAAAAVLQPLRGLGLFHESIDVTWARFFPDVPPDERRTFPYPQPLSNAFWKMYAEPLQDFLSGARALREALSAIRLQKRSRLRGLHAALTGGPELALNALISPIAPGAAVSRTGKTNLHLVGNSLLASLAMMMIEDLSLGKALQCKCGQLFVSAAYQARYCSERCRWRFEQRSFRSRPYKES